MDIANIIKNLDKLTNLLTIPNDNIPINLRYGDGDDDYCNYFFPQKTESVFEELICDIQHYYKNAKKKIYTTIDIDTNELYTLFEDIKNPVLIYESYFVFDKTRTRMDMGVAYTYLFMWDHTDGSKVFYLYDYYDCEYHICEKGRLSTQTIDSYIEECKNLHLYWSNEKGVDQIIKQLTKLNNQKEAE